MIILMIESSKIRIEEILIKYIQLKSGYIEKYVIQKVLNGFDEVN